MSQKTAEESFKDYINAAKKEKDPVIRALIIKAAEEYLKIAIEEQRRKVNPKPADNTKILLIVLVFFIVIIAAIILAFKLLSFWAGIGTIIGAFALLCLMMGVILLIQGHMTQPNFLKMITLGFKAILKLFEFKEKDIN